MALIPALHYSYLWLYNLNSCLLVDDRVGTTIFKQTELTRRKFNVIIHLANDSWQFNDLWKLHVWLIKRRLADPALVLLEAGWKRNYIGPVRTMREIRRRYLAAGFRVMEDGEFKFDCPGYHLPTRFYAVLGRGL